MGSVGVSSTYLSQDPPAPRQGEVRCHFSQRDPSQDLRLAHGNSLSQRLLRVGFCFTLPGSGQEAEKIPGSPHTWTFQKCVFTHSPGSGVSSNQVPKLPKDVATDLHHILMTGWGLECLGGRDKEGRENHE